MKHVLVTGGELSLICQLPLKDRVISWVVYLYTRPPAAHQYHSTITVQYCHIITIILQGTKTFPAALYFSPGSPRYDLRSISSPRCFCNCASSCTCFLHLPLPPASASVCRVLHCHFLNNIALKPLH